MSCICLAALAGRPGELGVLSAIGADSAPDAHRGSGRLARSYVTFLWRKAYALVTALWIEDLSGYRRENRVLAEAFSQVRDMTTERYSNFGLVVPVGWRRAVSQLDLWFVHLGVDLRSVSR